MTNMISRVEFLAGTSVKQAVYEARTLARANNLAYVKFDFNGVSFSVSQKADPDKCEQLYNEVRMSGDDKWVIN